jgi:hypothetical protein
MGSKLRSHDEADEVMRAYRATPAGQRFAQLASEPPRQERPPRPRARRSLGVRSLRFQRQTAASR